MLGAILGDSVGAPYEAHSTKSTEFDLVTGMSRFTDDTVMTIAICEGIMNAGLDADEEIMEILMVESCIKWGRKFPRAGYGGTFRQWLKQDNPLPYGSYGNGSAMRVSSVGWFFDSLERTREVARWSAEITHNHPEGIKGAESVASAIWMARNGKSKEEIKDYIQKEFGYDLERTCAEIRPDYMFQVTCQKSVPEAIIAFLDGNSYEECVKLAVSLGGDADTQACIAGSIAEAFYGMTDSEKQLALTLADKSMLPVIEKFETLRIQRKN